jgi:hypothetical protein
MKSKRHQPESRVELGRVTAKTRGSVFGTIEQVGLYQPAGISER